MKALLPVGCNERTAFASDAPSAILPFWDRALTSCLLDENRLGGGATHLAIQSASASTCRRSTAFFARAFVGVPARRAFMDSARRADA